MSNGNLTIVIISLSGLTRISCYLILVFVLFWVRVVFGRLLGRSSGDRPCSIYAAWALAFFLPCCGRAPSCLCGSLPWFFFFWVGGWGWRYRTCSNIQAYTFPMDDHAVCTHCVLESLPFVAVWFADCWLMQRPRRLFHGLLIFCNCCCFSSLLLLVCNCFCLILIAFNSRWKIK